MRHGAWPGYVPPADDGRDPVASVNGAAKWLLAAWLVLAVVIVVAVINGIETGPADPATVSTTPNPPADGPTW